MGLVFLPKLNWRSAFSNYWANREPNTAVTHDFYAARVSRTPRTSTHQASQKPSQSQPKVSYGNNPTHYSIYTGRYTTGYIGRCKRMGMARRRTGLATNGGLDRVEKL